MPLITIERPTPFVNNSIHLFPFSCHLLPLARKQSPKRVTSNTTHSLKAIYFLVRSIHQPQTLLPSNKPSKPTNPHPSIHPLTNFPRPKEHANLKPPYPIQIHAHPKCTPDRPENQETRKMPSTERRKS